MCISIGRVAANILYKAPVCGVGFVRTIIPKDFKFFAPIVMAWAAKAVKPNVQWQERHTNALYKATARQSEVDSDLLVATTTEED